MEVGSIVHIVSAAVGFLAGAYIVFVLAQKAEGPLKPTGLVLAALLAVIALLGLVSPLMGKSSGSQASTSTATSTDSKPASSSTGK